jgi:MFS family permease
MARKLIILCLASASWAFCFGLSAPLASCWLQDKGHCNSVIGAQTSVYYLGIALASGFVPWMMRRWGRGCAVAGMVASGLAVAVLPWSRSMEVWFLLRFVNGVAGAMSLIPMESFVNRQSPPGHRTRNFGFYAFAVALGWALGNYVGLQMYPHTPRLAFLIGAGGGILAGLTILCGLPWPEEPLEDRRTRTPLQMGRNLLSYGSAWSQGFLEGAMVTFLPVYLFFLGLANERVSCLTSGIMIGVIIFQVPVAWLAERLSRTGVLLGCYGVTAVALGSLRWCGDSGWLAVWLFLAGACSGAFYPLGLAILGDRMPKASLARANAWYLAINCCGSLLGPYLTGAIMDWTGPRSMFFLGVAVVLSVLVCWLISRRVYSARLPQGTAVIGGEPCVEMSEAA